MHLPRRPKGQYVRVNVLTYLGPIYIRVIWQYMLSVTLLYQFSASALK